MSRKAELRAKLSLDDSQFTVGMQKALHRTEKFANQAVKVMAVAGAAAGAAMAAGIYKAVQAASNLNETISKTEAIFGRAADEMQRWASTAATAFGQSKQQALDGAAMFAVFGKSAGLVGDELSTFSKGLTELAADFASFHNVSVEEAINAIGAGLRGQGLPLQRFGILMDAATLKNEALRAGIIQTTNEALTPQQRVLAAHALIFAQAGDAQGDFARTSDGLANGTRILKAQIEDLTAEIGMAFLPAAQELVKAGNDMLSFFRETGVIDAFTEHIRLIPLAFHEATAAYYEMLAAIGSNKGVAFMRELTGKVPAAFGFRGMQPEEAEERAAAARKRAAGVAEASTAQMLADGAEKRKGGGGGGDLGFSGADGSGGGSGSAPGHNFGMAGGAGVFAPGFLTLSTGAQQRSAGIPTAPIPSALDMIMGHREMAGPVKEGKVDPFADFKFRDFGVSGPTGVFGGTGPKQDGTDTAYGVVRKGDAARKKREESEAARIEAERKEAESSPIVQAINRPAWVTQVD